MSCNHINIMDQNITVKFACTLILLDILQQRKKVKQTCNSEVILTVKSLLLFSESAVFEWALPLKQYAFRFVLLRQLWDHSIFFLCETDFTKYLSLSSFYLFWLPGHLHFFNLTAHEAMIAHASKGTVLALCTSDPSHFPKQTSV